MKWISSALAIAIGAFILYVFVQAFGETYPGFREYGWLLMGAYTSGAMLFLKYGLSRKK
jgi:hypothetical protein